MTERTRFVCWMLGLALGGIVLSILGHTYKVVPLTAIGEALAVAGILGATVDPFLKAKLTAETFDAALRAVVGKDPAEPIRAELRRIALCDIIREQFEVEFQFDPPTPDGSLVVREFVTFVAHNTSVAQKIFAHTLWVQNTQGSELLRARCMRGETVEYDLAGDELSPTPSERGWIWQRDVAFGPDERIRFRGESKRQFPALWEEAFYFSHPTIGARVRVIAPPSIEARVMYHHENRLKTDDFVSGTWELINEAFLPHMSFTIGWHIVDHSGEESHTQGPAA